MRAGQAGGGWTSLPAAALGALAIVHAGQATRTGHDARGWLVLGVVLVVVPAALVVLHPRGATLPRVAVAVVAPALLQLATATSEGAAPVPWAGLASHPVAAVTLLVIARAALALGVLALVAEVTGSVPAAAAAALLLVADPGARATVGSGAADGRHLLALALAVLAAHLLLTRRGRDPRALAAPLGVAVAVGLVDPLGGLGLAVAFVVWAGLEVVAAQERPAEAPRLLGCAVVTLVGAGLGTVVAPGPVGATLDGLGAALRAGPVPRLGAATGGEQALVVVAAGVTLLTLGWALWRFGRRLLSKPAAAMLLALLALAHPVLLAAGRPGWTAGAVHVGVAAVIGSALTRRTRSGVVATVCAVLLVVVTLGAAVLGGGPLRERTPVRAQPTSGAAPAAAAAATRPADAADAADAAGAVGATGAAGSAGASDVAAVGAAGPAAGMPAAEAAARSWARAHLPAGADLSTVDAAGARDALRLAHTPSGYPGSLAAPGSRYVLVPGGAAVLDDGRGVRRLYDDGRVVVYDLGAPRAQR
ncbi:hypothetical protein GCM10025868_09690 [Angustibacter aerolatus]|uniref:Glycosyltransferase RgtA/B/C/D-like domain-containing protein n=1 Tax=Angustibacter aerolatus TaxID=1162965 RepID=A0ABQ6JE74_9ACTN|nr:hypothetical protein [Angustibacter aerolatus]GMA85719.1 hypothetical protein GCM10025868_09690 [Angustibacter aerolatus]